MGGEIRPGPFYRPERRRRAQKSAVGRASQPASLGAISQSLKLCFCRRKLCPEITETSLRETCPLCGKNWSGRRSWRKIGRSCLDLGAKSSPRSSHFRMSLRVLIDRHRGCFCWVVSPRSLARSGCILAFAASTAERKANDSLACEENSGKSKGDKGGRRGRGRPVDDRGERARRAERLELGERGGPRAGRLHGRQQTLPQISEVSRNLSPIRVDHPGNPFCETELGEGDEGTRGRGRGRDTGPE